jgi:hypothetical protein
MVDNKAKYGTDSRLRSYPLVYDEQVGAVRFGMKDRRLINKIKKEVPFKWWKIPAKYEFRADLISLEHYGTPKLWWVITGVNEIFHPFKELSIDKYIKIPEPNTLRSVLG